MRRACCVRRRAFLPPVLLVGKSVSLFVGLLIEGGGSILRRRVLRGQPVVALSVAPVISLFVASIVALPETLIITPVIPLIAVIAARLSRAARPGWAAGLRVAVEIGVLLPVVAGAACLGAGPLVRICGAPAARTGPVFRALAAIMRPRIRPRVCARMLSRM